MKRPPSPFTPAGLVYTRPEQRAASARFVKGRWAFVDSSAPPAAVLTLAGIGWKKL